MISIFSHFFRTSHNLYYLTDGDWPMAVLVAENNSENNCFVMIFRYFRDGSWLLDMSYEFRKLGSQGYSPFSGKTIY